MRLSWFFRLPNWQCWRLRVVCTLCIQCCCWGLLLGFVVFGLLVSCCSRWWLVLSGSVLPWVKPSREEKRNASSRPRHESGMILSSRSSGEDGGVFFFFCLSLLPMDGPRRMNGCGCGRRGRASVPQCWGHDGSERGVRVSMSYELLRMPGFWRRETHPKHKCLVDSYSVLRAHKQHE